MSTCCDAWVVSKFSLLRFGSASGNHGAGAGADDDDTAIAASLLSSRGLVTSQGASLMDGSVEQSFPGLECDVVFPEMTQLAPPTGECPVVPGD